jgi:hypothetical protein
VTVGPDGCADTGAVVASPAALTVNAAATPSRPHRAPHSQRMWPAG